MTLPATLSYLNGDYLPLNEARVSVMDRGFIFGDGIYEVIPIYNGRPFRLEQHLERLDHSLAAIRLSNPLSATQWRDIVGTVVARNGSGDQSIYVQVTRGVAPRDHAFPQPVTPTVFVTSSPLKKPTPEMLTGVGAVTLEDIRWKYCHIKAITLLSNILLRQQAIDADCTEAILIKDGTVTEGTASNVFVVLDGRLLTPPKGPDLLPGITRDVILELAAANGIDCAERAIRTDELQRAGEIWLTSSTREVLPVISLDDRPVGSGMPGPLWRRVLDLYQEFRRAL